MKLYTVSDHEDISINGRHRKAIIEELGKHRAIWRVIQTDSEIIIFLTQDSIDSAEYISECCQKVSDKMKQAVNFMQTGIFIDSLTYATKVLNLGITRI